MATSKAQSRIDSAMLRLPREWSLPSYPITDRAFVDPNGKKLGLSAYWDRNLQNEQDRLLIPTAAYI